MALPTPNAGIDTDKLINTLQSEPTWKQDHADGKPCHRSWYHHDEIKQCYGIVTATQWHSTRKPDNIPAVVSPMEALWESYAEMQNKRWTHVMDVALDDEPGSVWLFRTENAPFAPYEIEPAMVIHRPPAVKITIMTGSSPADFDHLVGRNITLPEGTMWGPRYRSIVVDPSFTGSYGPTNQNK